MIDSDGREWITIAQACERLPQLRPGTVRLWIHRRQVAAHVVSRRSWVCWPDILQMEGAARRAGWRTGQRRKAL